MKVVVDVRGEVCPIPVIKAKQAIASLKGAGLVEVLVDNENASQNVQRMGSKFSQNIAVEQYEPGQYRVSIAIDDAQASSLASSSATQAEECCAAPQGADGTVVQIRSAMMGVGDEALGRTLLKGFIYALVEQSPLPEKVIFYNGGAPCTCEGSPMLEDLRNLESQGVQICTCGTCLDHYQLRDKLAVGKVVNMYDIVTALCQAGRIVSP